MHLTTETRLKKSLGVIFTCCVKRSRPQQPLHVQRRVSLCSLKSFSSIPEHYYTDYRWFSLWTAARRGSAAVRRSGSSQDRTPWGSAALPCRSRIYPDPHSSPSASTANSPRHFASLSRCCSRVWSRWNCLEVRSRRLCRYWSLIIRLTTTSGSPPSPFSVLNFCHLIDSMREGVAGIWGRMRGRGFGIDRRSRLQKVGGAKGFLWELTCYVHGVTEIKGALIFWNKCRKLWKHTEKKFPNSKLPV